MIAPRRFLPSVTSMLALEAVERLGSATLAAAELSLTHSAISRQLKHLEEQIGVALFQRSGRALTLTPAGRDYADSTRGYLQDLARASLKIRVAGAKARLNLAVLPAFGSHWLIPRLKPFADANPGVVLNFTTRLEPIDFAREAFDAAIHFGQRDWQGVEYRELMRESVIPAGPRSLLPGGGVTPQALLDLPLLHLKAAPAPGRTGFAGVAWRLTGWAACCSTSSPTWPRRRPRALAWHSCPPSCRRPSSSVAAWCPSPIRMTRWMPPTTWSGPRAGSCRSPCSG